MKLGLGMAETKLERGFSLIYEAIEEAESEGRELLMLEKWRDELECTQEEMDDSCLFDSLSDDEEDDVTGTKPVLVKLLGETYPVEHWYEVPMCVYMILHSKNPSALERLDMDMEINTSRKAKFSYDRKKLRNAKRLPNGLFYSATSTANEHMNVVNHMLELCGIDSSELEIKKRIRV